MTAAGVVVCFPDEHGKSREAHLDTTASIREGFMPALIIIIKLFILFSIGLSTEEHLRAHVSVAAGNTDSRLLDKQILS